MLLVDGPYSPVCTWSHPVMADSAMLVTGRWSYLIGAAVYPMSTGIKSRMSQSYKALCSCALLLSWPFLAWPSIHYIKSSGQPFSVQSAIIMWHCQVIIFLPVHCLWCKHCWKGFNQAQLEGMGFRPRNPRIVMYWHCGGLSAGMHATGWHSSFIQCCSHTDSMFLQQYQI